MAGKKEFSAVVVNAYFGRLFVIHRRGCNKVHNDSGAQRGSSHNAMLLDAGVALDRVQVILGHRDIGMTRRYPETWPEALRDAIAQTFGA